MWPQRQEPYFGVGGMPSQHPRQQTIHPGAIGTEDPIHQLRHGYHHRHHHHHHHHHHQCDRTTAADLPVPSNPRASRNMAEKQRRDNLNTNISTMAALVPAVAGSSRRMDKISILRLSAAFLRTNYTLGSGNGDFLPRQFKDFDLQYLVDNVIGGFLIVVTTTGKVVYVSRQVEQQLGHAQNELLGQSLYNFVCPDDHEELTRNLTPDDVVLQAAANGSSNLRITDVSIDNNSSSSEDSTGTRNERKPFQEQRRSFVVRMSQRTVSRRGHTQYQCLYISGVLRLAEARRNLDRRGAHREITSTSNDIVFVAVAELLNKRPFTKLSLLDANKDEYVTRHLLDGRIIFCDHRISVVAGYMSEEVSGLCAFKFMHKDDFRWTMIGLRQMYEKGESSGSSCYRLLSKNGEFIYLQTHGFLELDKESKTVVSFVCINMLVSPEEGAKLVKEMKNRFSARISDSTRAMIDKVSDSDSRSNSKGTLDDPLQLEDAITHLMGDLRSPPISPSPVPNTEFVKAAIFAKNLPPPSTQACQIGIKKIVAIGGDNSNPKSIDTSVPERPRSRGKPVECEPFAASNGVTESADSPTQDNYDRSPRRQPSSGKNLSVLDGLHEDDSIVETEGIVFANSLPSVRRDDSSSCSSVFEANAPQSAPVNVERTMNGLVRADKRHENSSVKYPENGTDDDAIYSDSETSRQGSLKRVCSSEDVCGKSSKRKPRDVSFPVVEAETKEDDDQEALPYFAENELATLPVDFEDFTETPPVSRSTQSPNPNVQDANVDYKHLEAAVPLLPITVPVKPFDDFQDFRDDDVVLGTDLDENPDLMMKIFDNLRPVMNFEKNFVETKVQQLTGNNLVDEGVRRTHLQLSSGTALRDSQFDAFTCNIENSALQAQRKNLTQLQVEHKMQQQLLKTLQQDQHGMQVNMKHNVGV